MESLYVCLFSNGHIKVGRSNDPKSRIAQHADRVSCMGVELISSESFACENAIARREQILIARCVEAATRRFANEWFDGLEYLTVCGWALEAAAMEFEDVAQGESFGARLRQARVAAGMTQTDLGRGVLPDGSDASKATVSHWEVERTSPSVPQLRLLCERLGVSADFLLFGSSVRHAPDAPFFVHF
jgi:DNA-binding XRE family transcriptional regulator